VSKDRPQRAEASTPAAPAPAAREDGCPVFKVEHIVGDTREAVLVHKGARYRLRITSNDKLILTK
jgi:hemin uptake protein HemP